jgi:hypothetical protein
MLPIHPSCADDDPDRFLKCQEALQPAFNLLISYAVQAGWRESEVLAAVIDLADRQALANIENADVDRILAVLKKR